MATQPSNVFLTKVSRKNFRTITTNIGTFCEVIVVAFAACSPLWRATGSGTAAQQRFFFDSGGTRLLKTNDGTQLSSTEPDSARLHSGALEYTRGTASQHGCVRTRYDAFEQDQETQECAALCRRVEYVHNVVAMAWPTGRP